MNPVEVVIGVRTDTVPYYQRESRQLKTTADYSDRLVVSSYEEVLDWMTAVGLPFAMYGFETYCVWVKYKKGYMYYTFPTTLHVDAGWSGMMKVTSEKIAKEVWALVDFHVAFYANLDGANDEQVPGESAAA